MGADMKGLTARTERCLALAARRLRLVEWRLCRQSSGARLPEHFAHSFFFAMRAEHRTIYTHGRVLISSRSRWISHSQRSSALQFKPRARRSSQH